MTTIEDISKRYGDRILKILENIRLELHERTTLTCQDPEELDAEWAWAMLVLSDSSDMDSSVDVKVEIVDSEEHEGVEGGVTFRLDVTSYGGHTVCQLTPYNYTEECWVKRANAEAVEERFSIIEQADVSELTYLLVDWYRQERKDNVANVEEV